MLYDLLHHWPLEMVTFWLFPLFFACKFRELGLLGLRGRGIPVLNSRRRWRGVTGKACALALLAVSATLCAAFLYWLVVAIARRFFIA